MIGTKREKWIITIFLTLLIFAALTAHVGAWYSSDWDYRKEFTINNTGSELTNYQVMFTVNRSAGSDTGFTVFLDGKCESDYDDVRFVMDDDVTPYNYWIESSSATVATIWVEVPSIPTGDTTGYLYYGNSGASAVSNGDNTFDFFDDFLGSSLDTIKWTKSGGGTETVASSVMTLSTSAVAYTRLTGNTNFGNNYVFEAYVKTDHAGNQGMAFECFSSGPDTGGNYQMAQLAIKGSNSRYSNWDGALGAVNMNPAWASDTWEILTLKKHGQSDWYQNRANLQTPSGHFSTTAVPPTFEVYAYNVNYTAKIYVDWILVRKYAATEPTVSAWGGEEARPTVAAFSANVTTGNAPLHVGFTDASTGVGLSNWTWDFQNDDTPDSYDQNSAFTYTITGVYTVNLTVTGTGGTDSEIKGDYITVTNATPTPTPTPTSAPLPLKPFEWIIMYSEGFSGLLDGVIPLLISVSTWAIAILPFALIVFFALIFVRRF